MGGLEIASLFAKVGADVSDFDKGMKQVKDDLSAAEKGMSGLQGMVGAGLKMAAGVGVAAIGGLAAGIGHAVTKAADMEQGIANIAASMQLGKEETAGLKDLIMDLGLDPKLKTTAVEAAQAIEVLGTAGLTLDEIMNGAARSTVLLANSTGADFAQAGSIASDVMAQFNIKAADMAKAVDQITGVTVASKFDINDYGLAIAQAGGVAGSVGVDFDDFNATIAATSPSFASGSDAGTSFKTFLQRLVPTTNDAKQALLDLGLSTGEDVVTAFFTADGAMRPMAEIAENLQNAFSGLSEAQKIEAASTIFGTDAMRTALSLAAGGGEIIAEMKSIIGNTSAEESAATRMDTLTGAWEIFTGVLETLTLGIGDKFIPIVRVVVDWLATLAQTYGPMVIEWAGKFADAINDFFGDLADGNTFLHAFTAALTHLLPIETVESVKSFIDTLVNLWDTINSFIAPIAAAISQFFSWQDVLAALGVVIASVVLPAIWGFLAAAAPIVGMFALIVAASALLRNAWQNDWLGIRSAITFAWDIIAGVFNSVMIKISWIVSTFQEQWAVLTSTNATLGEKLSLVWNMIKDVAHTVWQGIVTTVQILWPKFRDAVLEWGTAAWEWLSKAIPIALEQIGEWGAALWGWVQDKAPKWMKTLAEWAGLAWQWIVDATRLALTKLGEWGAALWKWVKENAPKWIKQLMEWGEAAWQWIVDIVPIALRKLGEWGGALIRWLADKLPEFIKMIFEWGTALYKWIGDVIPNAINALADFIHGLRTKGEGEGTPTFIKMAGEWATKLWTWITDDLIPAVGPAFMDFIAAMGNYGLDLLAALGNLAVELALLLWEWIVDATPPALQKLGEWGAQLMGWISDNWPEWANKLTKWASAAWQWIVDATGPTLQKLGEWGARLWQWIVDNAPSWAAKLGQWARAAWQWIVEVTPIAVEKLREMGARLVSWVVENAPEWARKFLAAGRDIVMGLWDGIKEKWNNFTDWFGGVWGGLVDRFKNFFGIHSPSTLFATFGGNLMQGLADGISAAADMPINAMNWLSTEVQGKVAGMLSAVQNSANTIANTINSIPPMPTVPTTTPPVTTTTPGGGTGAGTGTGTTTTPQPDRGTISGGSQVAFGGKDLDLALGTLAGYVDISDTFQDIKDFAARAQGFLTNVPSSSEAGMALSSLQSGALSNMTVDRVLGAIQMLIRKIDEQGFGSKFNISAAPDATLQQQTELEELVSYLNALYG